MHAKNINSNLLNQQQGFTLIEILISLALGLLIIGGAFSYFLSTLSTSKSMLSQSKLQQDVRSTASLIQREIRRAGYTSTGHPDALTTQSIWLGKTVGSAINNCVIYYYIDENGVLHSGGFLVHDKKIYMKTSGTSTTCTKDGNWAKVTSAQNVEITQFKVEYINRAAETTPVVRPADKLPTIAITLSGQLSNDTTVQLSVPSIIILPNAPSLNTATTGS